MRRLRQTPLNLLTLPLLSLALLPGCFTDDAGGGTDGFNDDVGDTSGAASDDEAGTDDGWGEDGTTGTSDGGDTTDDGWDDEGDTSDDGEDPPAEDETDTDTETDTGEEICDEDNDVVLYLSPDDSNSESSPVQVRQRVLGDGSTNLGPIAIRTWEFMNYYGFDYAPAEDGSLSLYSAMAAIEGNGEDPRWQMQIAVASEVMTADERPPMNVTLVLDTSGSMSGAPINLLRETSRAIASQLRAGDKVSICEWDTQNTWTLAGYVVSGPNDPMVLEKINAVESGGGTDLNGGLVSGYELAQATWDADAINRLVLISDGGANAGETDIDIIADNAEYGGADGIYLVGVGVDDDTSYNDDLMDKVTDAGKGASLFLPTNEDIWEAFGANFESTMAIAARNVQVELTMPPGFEIVKFSGEEFSEDPKEVDPQHLAPNDAMVFHQQVETCAGELATDDAEIMVTVSWEDPWTFETLDITETWTIGELTSGGQAELLKGAAVLAYAESLSAFRQAYTNDQKAAALAPAFDALELAQVANPGDGDLTEIAAVLSVLAN